MNAEQLLEDVKNIRADYEKECRSKALDFNVFKILGASGYELPMRDFLYEILCLEGANGTGRIYLKNFFSEVLNIHDIDDDELKEIKIEREYPIHVASGQRQYGKIDLVFESRYRFIPIEVKVGSGEGEEQCLDYFSFGKKRRSQRQWGLYFLTWDGYEPESTKILGNDEQTLIHAISWSGISLWLEEMLKLESRSCVAEFIRQYIQVIENKMSNPDGRIQMSIVEKLTESEENFRSGLEVVNSLGQVKARLVYLVMEEFDRQMSPLLETHGLEKVLEPKRLAYDYGVDDGEDYLNRGPGINYRIKAISDDLPLWFRIQFDYSTTFFCGFCLLDEDGKKVTADVLKKANDVLKMLRKDWKYEEVVPNSFSYKLNSLKWFDWCYLPQGGDRCLSSLPRFYGVNDAAIELASQHRRENFVKESINFIDGYLK